MEMLGPEVKRLINEQIQKEFYSAYLYLDFANYFKSKGLDGYANWYSIQVQEEVAHAQIFMNYMHDNDCFIELLTIDKPKSNLDSIDSVLKQGYEHEQFVTASINTIYDAAYSQRDFRTMQFLDWFIKEQGEEEANASDMITKYELFGKDARALYSLDNEYKARTYTIPSPLASTNV